MTFPSNFFSRRLRRPWCMKVLIVGLKQQINISESVRNKHSAHNVSHRHFHCFIHFTVEPMLRIQRQGGIRLCAFGRFMCSSYSSFEYFTDFNCAQRSMWDLERFIDKWSEQQYSGDVHKESCDTSVVHSETNANTCTLDISEYYGWTPGWHKL